MATTSTLIPFQTALRTALRARAELAGVQVEYAWPSGATADEVVYFDDTVEFTSRIATIKAGRKQRDETYSMGVAVWVVRLGESSTPDAAFAAFTRADALMSVLDQVLAENPSLGVNGVISAKVTEGALRRAGRERGWAAEYVATIEVTARLV